MAKKFKVIEDGNRVVIESSENVVVKAQIMPEMMKDEIHMITDEIRQLKHRRRKIIKELKAINTANIGVTIKDIPKEII